MPANDALEALVLSANGILSGVEGSFADSMSFQMMGDQDLFNLTLRAGPGRPDVMITLGNIHRISVSKPPEADGSFIDEAKVSLLPQTPARWPAHADALVNRHERLPDLFWLKLVGPTMVDVVAANLTVSVAHAYL